MGIVASLWELALIIGLKQAIFAVWILILILQFFVYISMWQIRLPKTASLLLFELRRIVLGEFMEDIELGDTISESIGLQTKAKSGTDEKLGRNRLGDSSIGANLGITILFISIIFLLIILLIVLIRRIQKSV